MNEFITVYSSEVTRRLRSRIFLIGLLIGAFGIFALIKLPQLVESAYQTQAKKIVLAGNPLLTQKAEALLKKDFTVVGVSGAVRRPSLADLHRNGAKAIVALETRGGSLRVTAYASDPGDIEAAVLRRDLLPLNIQLATNLPQNRIAGLVAIPVSIQTVASKFGSVAQSDNARTIAYLLLFLLYLLIMLNSQLIMASVAEEKTSRIAELLIASVSPTALLAGKILSSVTLALVQLAVWLLVTFAAGGSPAGSVAGNGASFQFSIGDVSEIELIGFFVFFVLAFFQTATLFAAVASLVNRTEDLGSVSGPLLVPVIGAFFIAMIALRIPDSPWIVAASLVPM
ncbi:MAG: ABC transporter permease, partial [Candidatus Eremiobacteraeota bacterium]|nr:ABC transporter permease [Candidatus Eremiobacteraeota bacterium]